jgi:hypothetical protein
VGGRWPRRRPEPPPGWRWKDVSHDARFLNSTLAEKGMPRGVRRLKIG